MDQLTAIRCTVNSASITSADLIEAADEIAAEIDLPVNRRSIAEVCCLPADCGAITSHVVALITRRQAAISAE